MCYNDVEILLKKILDLKHLVQYKYFIAFFHPPFKYIYILTHYLYACANIFFLSAFALALVLL